MTSKGAIIITRFPYESAWGGEESHTLDVADSLRDKGYEPVFLGSCPILRKKFLENGYRVRRAWAGKMIVTPLELLKSVFLAPFIWWNLRGHMRKLSDLDIQACYMLSLNEKLFLTGWMIERGIPVTWVEHQEMRAWMIKSPWRFLYKKYANRVKIVPVSPKNERILKDVLRVPKDNIVRIVNGVNISAVQEQVAEKEKGLLLIANRMIPKKGIAVFLRALQILKNENIIKRVIVLGEGEEEKSLKEFSKSSLESVNIEFYKFLKKENYYQLLNRSDVFVSSALDENETFSLSSAEALAAGCKLVVTNCSGIAHFLDDKKEAFICQPTAEDMAQKIKQALTATDDMRSQAKKAAQQKFNQGEMLKNYHALILRQS